MKERNNNVESDNEGPFTIRLDTDEVEFLIELLRDYQRQAITMSQEQKARDIQQLLDAYTNGSMAADSSAKTLVGHVRKDTIDVYAGRSKGGKHHMLNTPIGHDGWLGNPFTVQEYGRENALRRYRERFSRRIESDTEFKEAVKDLAGKRLGCYCQRLHEEYPPCHAEIIAEYADHLAGEQD